MKLGAAGTVAEVEAGPAVAGCGGKYDTLITVTGVDEEAGRACSDIKLAGKPKS